MWAGNSGSQPAAGSGTCGSGTLSSGINGASYANNYTYTHLGQLSQIISNGTQSQYLYCNSNAPHQLSGIYSSSSTCSSRSGASYTSSYDSWGNVTSRTFNHTTATLSYDSLDHFVEWNAGNTNQQWNVYDGSGNRVLSRSISSSGHSVTVYAFGLEEHTYTFDSGGTLLSQNQVYYYSLGGSLLGALEVGNSSNTNFFLTDALGSVLANINNTANSAAVQGNQLYDPYGNSRYSSGTIGTSKGFTGQYADATGLDYYGSRYYDPAASVFLSADPLQGDLAGANPYEYVGSNPETNTDPSGERFISPSGGQQGPLGPINSDNVPYTPPTYPSPGGLGAGQVGGNIGGNTLNLQLDSCTQLATAGHGCQVNALAQGAPTPVTVSTGLGGCSGLSIDVFTVCVPSSSPGVHIGHYTPTVSLSLCLPLSGGCSDHGDTGNDAGKSATDLSSGPDVLASDEGGSELGDLGDSGSEGGVGNANGGEGPSTTTVYRVQGGGSKERIVVTPDGNIQIKGKDMLYLNFGNYDRAIEFLGKRTEDAYIVQFEVENGLVDVIQSEAKLQYKGVGREFPTNPQLVDPSSPGQYGLPESYFDLLKEFTIPGSAKITNP